MSDGFNTASLGELVTVETSEKVELAKQSATYSQILQELKTLQIADDDDYEYAGEFLKSVKRLYNDVEARRKKVTDPLNAALKEFRSWYKPTLDLLEEGERLLKKKIGDYALRKEQEREEQMRQIAAASAQGDFDSAHTLSQNISDSASHAGISVQRKWDYRVVDMSQVPRAFLCLDHSAMKIHIKSAGKDKPAGIPGIEFFETSGVIART
jgi:hypothetical protein